MTRKSEKKEKKQPLIRNIIKIQNNMYGRKLHEKEII